MKITRVAWRLFFYIALFYFSLSGINQILGNSLTAIEMMLTAIFLLLTAIFTMLEGYVTRER